tara:strand:- start:64 stop:591 length:528 start_codon:yes stop_codon:yes gene_type:complete
MKTSSAKAKGRNLQKWVREKLIEMLDVHPEDIESRSMGAGGEDLIMARAARQKFPHSIECKNVERLNVWDAYEQACENSGDYEPIVVMKKNRKKPLIVVDAEYFIGLFEKQQINISLWFLIMPRGRLLKVDALSRVLKLKKEIGDGVYDHKNDDWRSGADHMLNRMLDILNEYSN